MIGKSSTEGERKKQERLKFAKLTSGHLSEDCPETSEKRPLEYRDKSLELRDKSLDIRIEREEDNNDTSLSISKTDSSALGKFENVILTDDEIEKLKSELNEKYEY